MVEWQQSANIRSKWRIKDEKDVVTYFPSGYHLGCHVEFEPRWVYMPRSEFDDAGYYSVWYKHRVMYLYKLCMGLMNAGIGNISQQDMEVLRLWCRDWEDVGLPSEFVGRIGERRKAEKRADEAAGVLCVATEAIYLWVALCNELRRLEDELGLYGEPSPSAPKFTIDPRLNTDRARAMFDVFERAGFIMRHDGEPWEWLKPHTFLGFAYFVEKASVHLGLTTTDYNGQERHCRMPFEKLFNSRSTSGQKPPKTTIMNKIDNIFRYL